MTTDQRKTGIGESTLTVRWWAVILVFLGLFGILFSTARDQDKVLAKFDGRISVNETRYGIISERLTEMNAVLKDIQSELRKPRMRDNR